MVKSKKDLTTFYIVRHGQSESNLYAQQNPDKPASQYGKFGASLTEEGKEQAHKVAERLRDVALDAIFSSDLVRAKETAEIIAQGRNLEVITNDTIRERYFGDDMSNEKKREIEKAIDALNEKEKFAFRYFPHGESGYDVINRFKKFLDEVIKVYNGKKVLIVNHGYVMRSFLIHEGFAKYDELRGGSITNAGYFVVETDGKLFKVTKTFGISKNRRTDDEE
ncbi:MAG: histidine phosphatase family protein [Candidatus Levyibacteriota bacterium]